MPKAPKKVKTVEIKKTVQVDPPAPADIGPKVVYDQLKMVEYSTTSKLGPLTPDDVKVMFGWETEKEYQARMVLQIAAAKNILAEYPMYKLVGSGEMDTAISHIMVSIGCSISTARQLVDHIVVNPGESKPDHWLFGDVYHCVDLNGLKVRCWNNTNNRPFDMGWQKDAKGDNTHVTGWCGDLVHTILHGQWAGPLTVPGETVNGETVRIGRYGHVLSGQHQGTALILADELLQKERGSEHYDAAHPKYPFWNGHDHCVIETIVVTGLSEDERVLRTIDYVKPRTVADMLYTMDLFRNNTPVERKDMTRMLSDAIDMLWDRTNTRGYKTHPEVVGFLERHKRLLKCVEHLFVENRPLVANGRRISKLRLNPGMCAALCFIMGSSGRKTDGDVYRNEFPPSERNLDWSYWDRAREFWASLAGDRSFTPVRTALVQLLQSATTNEVNQGLGGTVQEKLAILAKAWEIFHDHPDSAGPAFNDDDLAAGGALTLNYVDLDDRGNQLPDGEIKLVDDADFFGIDCPEALGKSKVTAKAPPEPPPPSREEIERATEEARRRREVQAAKIQSNRVARK